MKRLLGFALKFALSAALIAYMATTFDLGDAANRLAAVSPAWVLAAAAVLLILWVNNTVRWLIVLRAIAGRLGFWAGFRIIMIANFLNQALPSTIGGDAARMFFGRRTGLALAPAVNGVMLERVVTVLGLVLLVVVTQPFLLDRIGDNPAKYVFPALAILGVSGVVALMLLDRIPERHRRWAVVRGLAQLAADTKRLFLHPGYAVAAVGLGVFGQVLLSAMVYALARALRIDAIGLLDCLVLVPPVILVMTVPISIAGWGIREGAMIAVFAFIGVARGDAFVVSILFGLINLVMALPGGLVWLVQGGRLHDQPPNAEGAG